MKEDFLSSIPLELRINVASVLNYLKIRFNALLHNFDVFLMRFLCIGFLCVECLMMFSHVFDEHF
jgi:hypothetical protein